RERAGRGPRAATPQDGTRRNRHALPPDEGPLDGALATAMGWVRRLRLPLVALVLVLVALLGAALADRLLGSAPGEPAGAVLLAEYPRGGPPGGMIAAEPTRDGAPARADAAPAGTGDPRPT